MRSHPPSLHRPGTLLEDHDDQQAIEKKTGSQMLKNCKIKLSLWHKKISFEVKKSEINVLQNARNAVSARQPNFPPRYLYLRPCLVRRLVGSHPPVKKKKKLATVLYISCIRSPWPWYCQWHGHEFLAAVTDDWYYKEGVGAEGRGYVFIGIIIIPVFFLKTGLLKNVSLSHWLLIWWPLLLEK